MSQRPPKLDLSTQFPIHLPSLMTPDHRPIQLLQRDDHLTPFRPVQLGVDLERSIQVVIHSCQSGHSAQTAVEQSEVNRTIRSNALELGSPVPSKVILRFPNTHPGSIAQVAGTALERAMLGVECVGDGFGGGEDDQEVIGGFERVDGDGYLDLGQPSPRNHPTIAIASRVALRLGTHFVG